MRLSPFPIKKVADYCCWDIRGTHISDQGISSFMLDWMLKHNILANFYGDCIWKDITLYMYIVSLGLLVCSRKFDLMTTWPATLWHSNTIDTTVSSQIWHQIQTCRHVWENIGWPCQKKAFSIDCILDTPCSCNSGPGWVSG